MPEYTLTATEQLGALAAGQISAVDLLEQTIERAEAVAPILNPFALKLYSRARQAAEAADKKRAAASRAGSAGCRSRSRIRSFSPAIPAPTARNY